MDINVFPANELPIVLRALRTALATEGPLAPNERAFLDTYGRIVGYEVGADPAPVPVQEVRIDDAHRRKRLVQLAALAVLLGRPVKAESFAYLQALAKHLATHDAVIDVITALRQGRHLKVRMLAMRRAMRALLKEAYIAERVPGVLRFVGALFLKTPVNRDKLGRYKRLGLLPEGTLGREYWAHMTEIGFGFPGEPAGIADSVAYHDIGHVLTGHDPTPEGEIQQGAFQGGNRREDGFFFIQFVVLHFHHGVKVTPAAPPATGNFDPEKVLWAIHRGASCRVDITHQWDYWPLMPLSIEEARAQCGLLPAKISDMGSGAPARTMTAAASARGPVQGYGQPGSLAAGGES